MKNYFLIIGLVIGFLPQLVQAQAIHDALELRTYLTKDRQLQEGMTESRQELFYAILARNYGKERTGLTKSELIEAYRDNPFIGPLLPKDLGDNSRFQGVTGQRSVLTNGVASSGLGLPNSTFLLGLTDFLVGRTKMELNIAFFRELQKAINDSEEMRYLFPTTEKILLQIDNDIYQFKAFWEALRESFIKDLDNLVYNLDDYVQFSSRIKDPVVKNIVSDLFKVTELFYEKTAPADIIDYLARDAYLHTLDPKEDSSGVLGAMQNHLELLGILSASVEHEDGNGYWVKEDKLVELVRDPLKGVLFLGLVYQQAKEINIGGKPLGGYLAPMATQNGKMRSLLTQFKLFLQEAGRLQRLAKDMRARANELRRLKATATTPVEDLSAHQAYYDFTEGVCQLLLYANDFKTTITGIETNLDTIVTRFLSIASDLNSITMEIRREEYTSALVHTLFVIEKILPQDELYCERQLILKYGTFIATSVAAKTPQEVSDAIAAFALPPGSSAMKKYAKFSIALNAFVGMGAGQETLKSLGTRPYYAVATPIGVTFNMGFKNYGSIGVLASLVDIGALTAFRFQDDSANELPELRFENVLAPGGYLVYTIPKYPIAIGVGAQLGPNLRTVTNTNLGIDQTSGWRWGAFIAVDIPIVSLYNNNHRYKVCCKTCGKKKNR